MKVTVTIEQEGGKTVTLHYPHCRSTRTVRDRETPTLVTWHLDVSKDEHDFDTYVTTTEGTE